MKNSITRIILLGAVLVSSVHASPVSILSFQMNGIGVFQNGGANSFSGQFAWTPLVEVAGFGIRGELGGTVLKANFGNKFLSYNYQAFLRVPIVPFVALEGGGGLETWKDNGGTHPILSGDIALKLIGGIERVFIGYSRFLLPGTSTNEIRAGIGVTL